MNQKALKTLEYDKIIDRLTALAGCELGKQECEKLLPSSDIREISVMQTETADALSRLLKNGSISFGGVKEIRPSLLRLEAGGTLSIKELLAISSQLDTAARAKQYGRLKGEDEQEVSPAESAPVPMKDGISKITEVPKNPNIDSLQERFDALEPLTNVNTELKRCIVSEEEISDEASSGLKSVRRSIKLMDGKIHEQLNHIVNSSRTMLQDGLITMRNGRFCIPVKAEYRSQLPGMIHDQSSTGSTLFVEPASVVKLNNDLHELYLKEQEEIEKILAELSNLCAEHVETLRLNQEILVTFDFLFAKANLAKQMRASKPILNPNGVIHIKKGRHPLIDPKKVVPIDITLGKKFDLLVVTGPNTGGKTVSLKTTGLFTLMAQAGLHIPAFDNSQIAVFDEVYADIGDEQSIEQSLSTFSSHITNTISILNQATKNSLVLFDELGAGTDPVEGAALAMAILSHLHKRGIHTVATTHYSELKLYALSTKGVENACCEFDVESLRPTYRLLIGIPGKSNAFAISQKLGLSDEIIEDAKKRVDSEDQSFEDVISELEKSRITMEKEQAEISRYKEEIAQLKEQLDKKNEKIDQAKDKILRRANEQASEILQQAKDIADETIKKYNQWSKQSGLTKAMEEERAALRKQLDKTNSKLALKTPKSKKQHKPGDFAIGDIVKVLSLDLNGTVSTLPNEKGELYVQMGILRSQVSINDLEWLSAAPKEAVPQNKKNGGGSIKMSKSFSVSPEINLIGMTTAEAIPQLDKYLDDAYLAKLPQVTVIHGRGTGALRGAVHTHLKKTSYVKSFRVGGFGEGDMGVTIVEFK
jgi:DNA mismatch repair protein MutS2